MPVPVGDTVIVPGTGALLCGMAATATAAAPAPARPIHSHFFEPPPPPLPLETTWPAAVSFEPPAAFVSFTLRCVGSPTVSVTTRAFSR
jgi:hypothetical protein